MRPTVGFAAILLVFLLAPAARAIGLSLWVDVDGTTYIANSYDTPISFDGYQITSEKGTLDPVGWNSIADQVAADPIGIITILGSGALAFGEANPSGGSLAELNVAGAATLSAKSKFSIGKPFGDVFDLTVTGFYKPASSPTPVPFECFPYTICIPEPSSGALALCGCGGMLLLRRRRARTST